DRGGDRRDETVHVAGRVDGGGIERPCRARWLAKGLDRVRVIAAARRTQLLRDLGPALDELIEWPRVDARDGVFERFGRGTRFSHPGLREGNGRTFETILPVAGP